MARGQALFPQRLGFAVIAAVVLAAVLGLVALTQPRPPRFATFCETYSPGYAPKGCSAKDVAAWKALGLKPGPGSDLPKP